MEEVFRRGHNFGGLFMALGALFILIGAILFSANVLSGQILLAIIVVGASLEIFGVTSMISGRMSSKPSKEIDSAEPIFNLTIEIKCNKRVFSDAGTMSAEEQIEMFGTAIFKAKKILEGRWHVTKDGHLVRGFAVGLEKERKVVIDIDDNVAGLDALYKILKTKFKTADISVWNVHALYENGAVAMIKVDEKGLFLD